MPPDVRGYLHHELLAVGDVAGARRLADELRPERPADGDVYLFVGESYELVGDLREAHRWMTAAHAGPGRAGEDLAVGDAAGLVRTRYRVHRALDLPMDEYDERVDRRRSAD